MSLAVGRGTWDVSLRPGDVKSMKPCKALIYKTTSPLENMCYLLDSTHYFFFLKGSKQPTHISLMMAARCLPKIWELIEFIKKTQ